MSADKQIEEAPEFECAKQGHLWRPVLGVGYERCDRCILSRPCPEKRSSKGRSHD